jgi:hypothetical protein
VRLVDAADARGGPAERAAECRGCSSEAQESRGGAAASMTVRSLDAADARDMAERSSK